MAQGVKSIGYANMRNCAWIQNPRKKPSLVKYFPLSPVVWEVETGSLGFLATDIASGSVREPVSEE